MKEKILQKQIVHKLANLKEGNEKPSGHVTVV
jgi:hypothetical protein